MNEKTMELKVRLKEIWLKLWSKLQRITLVFLGIILGCIVATFCSCGSKTTVSVDNNAQGTQTTFSVTSPSQIELNINQVRE